MILAGPPSAVERAVKALNSAAGREEAQIVDWDGRRAKAFVPDKLLLELPEEAVAEALKGPFQLFATMEREDVALLAKLVIGAALLSLFLCELGGRDRSS